MEKKKSLLPFGNRPITGNTLRDNGVGIIARDSFSAAENKITGNSYGGVVIYGGGNHTLQSNWWGDIGGPRIIGSNTEREGGLLSDSISLDQEEGPMYSPWYTAEDFSSSSSEKAITSFTFSDPNAVGVIDESDKTVAIEVPYGTDVASLVPTITTSLGASVSPESGTGQWFLEPVSYIVTSADGGTETWIVTVSTTDGNFAELNHFLKKTGEVVRSWSWTGISGDNGYVYVGKANDGLYAYTFDGATFTQVGYMNTNGSFCHVFSEGGFIYSAECDGGLKVYSFDGITFSPVAETTNGESAIHVWRDGNYVYFVDGARGLYAYTFNGTSLVLAGEMQMNIGELLSVWGDGQYIYVAGGSEGFFAYTFSGTEFSLVRQINEIGTVLDVWGDGTYVYTANDEDGLFAFSKNGTSFTQKSNINNGGSATGVWGDGQYIYLANDTDGLRTYSFSGTSFANVGYSYEGGYTVSVWGDGAHVYVANNSRGFYAYKTSHFGKAITSFSFSSLNVSGLINEVGKTISFLVPFGSDISALLPSMQISAGASISPLANSAQDFRNIITYTVTAENFTTALYRIIVGIADPPASFGGGGGVVMLTNRNIGGDINIDGKVDEFDFSLLMASWGKGGEAVADINKDGLVDEYDFSFLMSSWG